MAKVQNMWLKGVTGKVGDSTLYVSGGDTILRNGKSNVKNPQSYAQMIQRVIAKTAMNQYSALQFIANHSFQGKASGSKCMERFLSLNMRYFRERAAQIQQAGGDIYELLQFAPVGSTKYTPAAVILSEGKLPIVPVGIHPNGDNAYFAADNGTYEGIIKTYGLKRGDQLTFVTVMKNTFTGEYIPAYARVILDPRNPDGTTASLGTQFSTPVDTVNYPNMRNRGAFSLLRTSGSNMMFKIATAPTAESYVKVCAAGIIASRRVKGQWLRSYCKLILNETVLGSDKMSLGAAVDASLGSTEIYTDEDLYLNNAGQGGVQAVPQSPVVQPVGTTLSNTVKINNIPVSVLAGAVMVDSLKSVKVFGANITDLSLVLEHGEDQTPFNVNEAGTEAVVEFPTAVTPNEQQTYTVIFSGSTWFNITLSGSVGGLE